MKDSKKITKPVLSKLFLKRFLILFLVFEFLTVTALFLYLVTANRERVDSMNDLIEDIKIKITDMYSEHEGLIERSRAEKYSDVKLLVMDLYKAYPGYISVYIDDELFCETSNSYWISMFFSDEDQEIYYFSDGDTLTTSNVDKSSPLYIHNMVLQNDPDRDNLSVEYRLSDLFSPKRYETEGYDPFEGIPFLEPGSIAGSPDEYPYVIVTGGPDGEGYRHDTTILPPGVNMTNIYSDPDMSYMLMISAPNIGPEKTEEDCSLILTNRGNYHTGMAVKDPGLWGRIMDRLTDKIVPENSAPFSWQYSDSVHWKINAAYADHYSFKDIPYLTVISLILALILAALIAFITSRIKYAGDKAVWDILEYRRKTTEAMAHDLKTPLAAISACVENLQDGAGSKTEEYYSQLAMNTDTMNRLVETILDFTRSEHSDFKPAVEEVDVNKLISDSLKEVEGLLNVSSLTVDITGDQLTLKTDPALFKQSVDNLISNFLRHSDMGTTVKIDISSKAISFANRTSAKIDDVNELKKAFVKGSRSRNDSGTGLGLAITDNNLQILGYRLKLSLVDGEFKATIVL